MSLMKLYYTAKPFIPRRVQLMLRRTWVRAALPSYKNVWPICRDAGTVPKGWSGWPQGHKFSLVLTHDVDTAVGQARCEKLVSIEQKLGFKSTFYFVPERYEVSTDLRNSLTSNGFEVGVHGLKHDGKLYNSKEIFMKRAARINHYLKEWNSVGFRSSAMHCNLDWIGNLDIEYDASTFDTDPFEPQPRGMNTIFPFWVPSNGKRKGYVELPYSMPQDSTVFVLMKEKNVDLWKKKLDWIARQGGMVMLTTHPDYMAIDEKPKFDTYPIEYYEEFLNYVKTKYEGQYWQALSCNVAKFWTQSLRRKNIQRRKNISKVVPQTADLV